MLLFGHLFGDYVFQNDWMALNKKKKGVKGWKACLVHCLIYTVTVTLFLIPLYPFNSYVWFPIIYGIFLSHIVLDRTYLIDRWFRFTKGRTWKRIGMNNSATEWIASVSYTAIVQTVADNTIHLVIMYFLCYIFL